MSTTAEQVEAAQYAMARKALAGFSTKRPIAASDRLVTAYSRTTQNTNCIIHPMFGGK